MKVQHPIYVELVLMVKPSPRLAMPHLRPRIFDAVTLGEVFLHLVKESVVIRIAYSGVTYKHDPEAMQRVCQSLAVFGVTLVALSDPGAQVYHRYVFIHGGGLFYVACAAFTSQ